MAERMIRPGVLISWARMVPVRERERVCSVEASAPAARVRFVRDLAGAGQVSSRVLRAWFAAAHGEALAAHGDQNASLHAFDRAAELLPGDPADERPYVALDAVHLARGRGHALARFGHPDCITILTDALNWLDPTFVRAETALRVDLATAHAANGNRDEARTHADHATRLTAQVGSARQRRRITALRATVC